MFDAFTTIKPRYIKGKAAPFRFMLTNPVEGDLAQADLKPEEAERVLTKMRKYETIAHVNKLKIWIADHLRKYHR